MPDHESTSGTLPDYEIFAIRYATREARSPAHFLGGDPHDVPMPMDYFIWLIRGPDRAITVDLGFNAESGARMQRQLLRCPIEALNLLGTDPASVRDAIVTHLHYDHAGNFGKLPNATFHLQERDLHYVTGRHMRHQFLRQAFNLDDVVGYVQLNFAGRMRLHAGQAEVAPGVTLHPVGGHTPGLQFVRVHTRRGWVVLASDTTHFYANMDRGRPFPSVVSTPDVLEAYDRLREAAESPDHIVPGHDPLVMQLYPAVSRELDGIVVRLDVAPAPRDGRTA